ncbi:hypothetical protein LINGRAHAP2_LOCUS33905 [Linum grandiflorum]
MAALTPGVLSKLIEAMDRGKKKPTREHRSSILQVTDIVPVDLDEKSLFPKGFYIKVSDSVNSIYVSLPAEQDDLVLSNKMQLGQFVYVDRLEAGTPVPVVRGAKPIPGRRPLTPETGEKKEISRVSNNNRRSSWGKIGGDKIKSQICSSSAPMVLRKRVTVDSDQCSTPAKQSGRLIGSKDRYELSKTVNRLKLGESSLMRKSRVASSPCISSAKKSSSVMNTKPAASSTKGSGEEHDLIINQSSHPVSAGPEASLPFDLPGKLSKLGKEAMLQRETAQKLAEQAVKEASATETLIESLKMFSDMTKSSSPESPAGCFEKFLDFHTQISQFIEEMNSIQAAAAITAPPATPKSKQCEKGKQMNTPEEEAFASSNRNRRTSLYKWGNSRLMRSWNQNPERRKVVAVSENDENKRPAAAAGDMSSVCGSGRLSRMMKLGKEIEGEAGIWFVEFAERALECGMKECSGKEVMMKLIDWFENEQCKGNVHHIKAAQIARRLRIKMKNP